MLPLGFLLAAAACGQEEQAEPVAAEDVNTGAVPSRPDGAGEVRDDAGTDSNGEADAAPKGGNGGNSADKVDGGLGNSEMTWAFSRSAAGPKLTYGEPNTDNIRLMLRCEGDRVSLNFIRPSDVATRRPDRLTVASGAAQREVRVSAEETELGGTSISASVPASAEPIRAFQSGRPLEVRWGQETIRVPGTDKAKQFLSACG